jgi:hypothetical protein
MAHALTMTMPIGQSPENLERLQQLKADFKPKLQSQMDDALRESKMVHFARVVVIHDKYLQVITEYDGDPRVYTEFFRVALPEVFTALFSVVEGAPNFSDLDQQSFAALTQKFQCYSLGDPLVEGGNNDSAGYLFSAYGDREVKDILPHLQA